MNKALLTALGIIVLTASSNAAVAGFNGPVDMNYIYYDTNKYIWQTTFEEPNFPDANYLKYIGTYPTTGLNPEYSGLARGNLLGMNGWGLALVKVREPVEPNSNLSIVCERT